MSSPAIIIHIGAVRAYVNPYLLLQNLCADTGVLLEKQQVSIELVKESAIPRFALDTTQFRQLFSEPDPKCGGSNLPAERSKSLSLFRRRLSDHPCAGHWLRNPRRGSADSL